LETVHLQSTVACLISEVFWKIAAIADFLNFLQTNDFSGVGTHCQSASDYRKNAFFFGAMSVDG
jgi:hypothetical protein